LRTRVNWVKERADKLAQQLPDEHGELTAALADIQQSVKRQRRSCKKTHHNVGPRECDIPAGDGGEYNRSVFRVSFDERALAGEFECEI
jgi:hypothetical protein